MHRLLTLRKLAVAPLVLLALGAAAQVPPDYFNGMQWRMIGPFRGGRSIAASGVPSEPATFYFGAVDGGVWKSTNAGLTWKPIFDGQPVASIGAVTVAPSNPSVIYVGTGESDIRSDLASGDGVYKSTDAGKTWQHVGLDATRQISKIAVDPSNPDIVYVAALGHAYAPNPERGVFKSIDGGKTWRHVLNAGPEIGASDLALASSNPKVLFAGMWNARRPPWSTYAPSAGPGSGLYRSQDAGQTWSKLSGNGLPPGDWGRVGVDVAPDGRRVYALIEAPNKQSGLYRSDDGGDSWTRINSDPRLTSRAWYFNWITVDPSNPDVIYVPNVALYRSEDGGKTISIVRGAPGGDDYHYLWVDPSNDSHLILATDQGTTVSLDRGKTWSSWYNQPTAQLYHVTTDDSFPYNVYGAQQDSGSAEVASRTDHGQITARDWAQAGGSESGYLAVDPLNPNIVYASGTYGTVARLDTKTSLSQDITPWPMPNFGTEINGRKYRDPWTPVLVFSPQDKKTLYFGSQFVMKTTDGGLHWQKISPDLTGADANAQKSSQKPTIENAKALGYGVVYTIAPSPLNAGVVWAGSDTGLIHVTENGGLTWNDVTPKGIDSWSKISLIEASHFHPAEAFAAVDRHRLDDQAPYIYRTRDYGKTWEPITNGIASRSFVRAVREDPLKAGLLYAGTEFGIYVSFDDGDHWQPLQLNLPVTSVRDMTVHGDDLIIATHGRSFWILDDITPLREATQIEKAAKAWLYAPATAVRIDNDSFFGTPLPPEEPTAQNPPDGAILDYLLKSPASQVTLEIYDSSNTLVRRYVSSEKREAKRPPLPIADRWFPEPQHLETTSGMHRFVWDLRWRSSGDSNDDEDSDYQAPKGPKVTPGVYTVKLTVDGETFTQKLTVKMDPRSQATPKDWTEQAAVGNQIYIATLNSRRALAEIAGVRKQLSDLRSKAPADSGVLVQIAALDSALDKMLKGQDGLESADHGLAAALRVVESSDRPIPSQALELFNESKQLLAVSAKTWSSLKGTDLVRLNEELQKSNLPPIKMAEIEEQVEYLMTR